MKPAKLQCLVWVNPTKKGSPCKDFVRVRFFFFWLFQPHHCSRKRKKIPWVLGDSFVTSFAFS